MEDLFSNDRHLTLQQLPIPPHLPSWLTQVGQAYRFDTEGSIPKSSILFRYLAKDVPGGQEAGLRIYYYPDGGGGWQRLETELNSYHNHASAQVQGRGVYALISTIEISPSFAEGWNSFSYLVRETRPIAEALSSIGAKYTAVANYNPNLAEPWRFHYRQVSTEFAGLVNTLTQLEYTRAYWLYATEAVTLFLKPDTGQAQILSNSPGQLQMPPATYYGWISPTEEFTPTAGMSVTAWIDDRICGQTAIQELDGQLAYVLRVNSENVTGSTNNCGDLGDRVVFKIDGRVMGSDALWDNSRAWFHSLPEPKRTIYLPMVTRP